MKRQVDLKDISDGKLYGLNDMVKTDCNDCEGCFACCTGMGRSVILDPLDIHRLSVYLNRTMEELLIDKIELNVADGVILPNLKMSGEEERCAFLNEKGRCSIHPYRPGLCRLFPLGRYYSNHEFQYFLQIHECRKENKSKIKVRKWIDTPDLKNNQRFIICWHDLLIEIEEKIQNSRSETAAKELNMRLLQHFFLRPYSGGADFYMQFWERLERFSISDVL